MPSHHAFEELYEDKLKDRLTEFDQVRRSGCRAGCSVFILGAIVIAIGTSTEIEFLIPIGFFGSFLFAGYTWYKRFRGFDSYYKRAVVNEVVKVMDPSWEYLPEKHISMENIKSASLFQDFNELKGEDLIRGSIEGHSFEICECHLTEVKKSTKSSKTWYNRRFEGLFFFLETKQQFDGTTILKTNKPDVMHGINDYDLSQAFTAYNQVLLQDPDFEKIFSVHSSNPEETLQIMTPSFRHQILEIRNQLRRDIYLSIKESRISVAIVTDGGNFLDPSLFRSNVKFEKVQEVLNYLDPVNKVHQEING